MRRETVVGLVVMVLAVTAIEVAAGSTESCVVSGSGASQGGMFGGSAASRTDLGSYGVWTFSTDGGDHFAGTVRSVRCEERPNGGGERTAALSGSVIWNAKAGYSFSARATDGSNDRFEIAIQDAGGHVIYGEDGEVRSGDIAVRP